jgi:hypothetical protein
MPFCGQYPALKRWAILFRGQAHLNRKHWQLTDFATEIQPHKKEPPADAANGCAKHRQEVLVHRVTAWFVGFSMTLLTFGASPPFGAKTFTVL